MKLNIPNTPFSTHLSGNAKETELRIRSIFQWRKRRPPVWLMSFIVLAVLGCGGLVSCQSAVEPLNVKEESNPLPEQEEVRLPESLVTTKEENATEGMEYSTITIGENVYETYLDNRGILRLKDALGNGYLMASFDYLMLPTLENGKYPINSRGETYGYPQLADFVGKSPDLIAVVNGLDSAGNPLDGYVWWEDYFAEFSDPAVAAKYEPSPDGIPKDARAGWDAQWWRIPMYDAEHNLVGTYDVYEGACQKQGNLIWWLENDLSLAQNAERSEIGAEASGTVLSNHGVYLQPIPYSYLTQERRTMLAELPNGTYPQNSRGEYYGTDKLKHYLQIEPDLISAVGTNGEEGYVWWEDMEHKFRMLEDLNDVIWNENGYLIPLYDSEHNQIGWKEVSIGISAPDAPGVELNIHTVDAIWAQVDP